MINRILIILIFLITLLTSGCNVTGNKETTAPGGNDGTGETGGNNNGNTNNYGEIRQIRPRLLLSPLRLEHLRQATNSQTWTTFETWVSTYRGLTITKDRDLPYGMAGWHLALAYMITSDTGYAETAISHVEYMVAKGTAAAIGSRFLRTPGYLENVAFVYDWLYDQLTTQQRNKWQSYMKEIVHDLWTPDPPDNIPEWGTDQPANNFYYGHLITTSLYAIAVYYEDTIAENHFKQLIDTLLPPAFNYLESGGLGGGWNEGTHYGQKSKNDLMQVLNLIENSGYKNCFQSLDFTRQALLFQLCTYQPGSFASLHYGDMAMRTAIQVLAVLKSPPAKERKSCF